MAKSQEDLEAAIESVRLELTDTNKHIISTLTKTMMSVDGLVKTWLLEHDHLQCLVPEHARPAWMVDARKQFSKTIESQRTVADVSLFIVERAGEMSKSIILDGAELDLERHFDQQRDTFGLPELFEALVEKLGQLIEADVIDNRTVQEALERLQALFKRNKRGSFAAVLLTMNYGRFFVNSFSGFLKANKYAKPIVESFETEFKTANDAFQKADEATKKATVAQLTNLRRLELFTDEHPQLGPTIAGYLPAPTEDDEAATPSFIDEEGTNGLIKVQDKKDD